jgi:uncharacterized DUF497 family protein
VAQKLVWSFFDVLPEPLSSHKLKALKKKHVEHWFSITATEPLDEAVGMTSVGLVLVSFTYRDDTVRLISARVAEK